MDSIVPSLDILRLNYMKEHPGFLFGLTETGIECPLEKDGFINKNGRNYWKWIGYVVCKSTAAAKEVGMNVPEVAKNSKHPYNRLLKAEENYNVLRQHPVFSSIIQKWRLIRAQ
jgi:hypothetical protein